MLLIGPGLRAQPAIPLEQVLERMSAYLHQYETQLSSVVADERFDQRVVYTRAYVGGLPKTDDERKRLESEIGFLRLPGGVDWIGFRDVRKINGRPVTQQTRRVADVLASSADAMSQAKVVADASAEHNLGAPRTTNVPTAALDVIHPSRLGAHQIRIGGEETIRRTRTVVLEFRETAARRSSAMPAARIWSAAAASGSSRCRVRSGESNGSMKASASWPRLARLQNSASISCPIPSWA